MQRNVTQSKKAVTNNRNLYYINLDICHGIFQELPILTFRRNKNLNHDLMECKNIVNGKVQRLIKNSKNGFQRNIFFHIQYFKSSVAQKRYLIFHDFNCKIKLLIYLIECTICRVQYVRKLKCSLMLG